MVYQPGGSKTKSTIQHIQRCSWQMQEGFRVTKLTQNDSKCIDKVLIKIMNIMMKDENASNFVLRCGTSGMPVLPVGKPPESGDVRAPKAPGPRGPTLHHRQDQTLLSALDP